MIFSCRTHYDAQALASASRALRKTLRASWAKKVRIFAWAVVAVSILCIYTAWDRPWQVAGHGLVALLLVLVSWKEDALNGFFARRRMLPGAEWAKAEFSPGEYQVQISGAVTTWQYEKIQSMVEDGRYLVLVLGKDHAQVLDLKAVEGGAPGALIHFLEEKTQKSVVRLGRAEF